MNYINFKQLFFFFSWNQGNASEISAQKRNKNKNGYKTESTDSENDYQHLLLSKGVKRSSLD